MTTCWPRVGKPFPPMPCRPRDGPKLRVFTDDLFGYHDVEFIDMVFAGPKNKSSEVYKARIDGKLCCLKVFHRPEVPLCFSHPSKQTSEAMFDFMKDLPKSDVALIWDQTMNFYNECRAYGRLKETGNEHLAGEVFGYVKFEGDDARYLKERWNCRMRHEQKLVNGPVWDTDAWEDRPKAKPHFAIIKEWLGDPNIETTRHGVFQKTEEGKRHATAKDLPQMLETLHQLHKLGIVYRNIDFTQFIDGKFFNFDSAWTIPHKLGPEGGVFPSWAFPSMASWDLRCFQEKVIDEYNSTAEYVNSFLGPGEKRMPRSRLRAHPYVPSEASPDREDVKIARAARLRTLRPRPVAYGPSLPLIDGVQDTWQLVFTTPPRYDPSAYGRDNLGKRKRGSDVGSGKGKGKGKGKAKKRKV